MAQFTIETDQLRLTSLQDVLLSAFPSSHLMDGDDPVRRAVGAEDVIQVAITGGLAFFTVSGGILPPISALKAILGCAKYREDQPTESPARTVLRYIEADGLGGTTEVDLSTVNEDVAIAAFKSIFGNSGKRN